MVFAVVIALIVNILRAGGQSIIIKSYLLFIFFTASFKINSFFSTPTNSISAPDKFTFDGNDTGYGMYILNYTLILELLDYNGDRIASFKFRGKDGGASEKDAKRVVMNKIVREINSNLSNQISDFLDEKLKN